MGKPRMIIVIRHAQSEGNKNREIHQMVPDHRVKLTPDGWKQAEDAGRRLRDMLRPDDTLRFFTSPYRRTRETTEGILRTLTSSDSESGPSPFPRNTIKVYEEPRLREQDFGNFQPCSAEMERMWSERADYGHFFYRIPNGESAADAYDRVSGFNESLWRSFSGDDFPSVCVLVTHGLMTRVFLMKWYHWTVEYFEDLRNVNHCEFICMRQNPSNGKYVLENQLRTWSELKRRAAAIKASTASTASTTSTSTRQQSSSTTSPSIPSRKWGGCVDGCNHDHEKYPRRTMKTPPADHIPEDEKEDHPIATQEADAVRTHGFTQYSTLSMDEALTARLVGKTPHKHAIRTGSTSIDVQDPLGISLRPSLNLNHTSKGRDGGGSLSGAATPVEGLSDMDSDGGPYFARAMLAAKTSLTKGRSSPALNTDAINARRKPPRRRATEQDMEQWAIEGGMGSGACAERLGDGNGENDADGEDEAEDDVEESNAQQPLSEKEKYDRSIQGSVY